MRLVLYVAEAGLRSTLVARLTFGGADVATVRDLTSYRLSPRRRAVLVADATGVSAYPGGTAALCADPRWSRLVVLTDVPRPEGAPPHLHHLRRADADATLPALLDAWRREA